MYKQQRYNPNKQLDLTKNKNKLNIIQKDLNKKDYNNIKELVEEKQNNIISVNNIEKKIKKILPPSENNKKKYKK